MIPLSQVLSQATRRLKQSGADTPELDARLLLQKVLDVSRDYLIAHRDEPLSESQYQAFLQLIARREKHEPVSRILGTRGFWSLEFTLSPATLDPRPDSETIIESALNLFPDRKTPLRILDLGTGTGCLLLSLLHEYPAATGLGVDISPEAVQTATQNAKDLKLSSRAQFQKGSWTQGVTGVFDLIISNPPYIPTTDISTLAPEVQQFDPRLALDGGLDGLDAYRTLAPTLPALLAPNGYVIFEVGQGQADDVSALLSTAGLENIRTQSDLAGIARVVIAGK